MITFTDNSVNMIYLRAATLACESCEPFLASRVGPARDLGPVMIEVQNDTHRLVFVDGRAMNPYLR
jgi:hypothetical protein